MGSTPSPVALLRAPWRIGREVGAFCLLVVTFAGCSTLTPDHGFSDVRRTVADRVDAPLTWARSDADRRHVREVVAGHLSQPLDADSAVAVAPNHSTEGWHCAPAPPMHRARSAVSDKGKGPVPRE